METIWKAPVLCIGFLFFQLCNGLPINLENSVADSHTQFLTGLVAILLTICTVVFLVGCVCCQRGSGFKEFRDSPVVASAASNLDHGHVNPIANGEFTIFTPLSPSQIDSNVFQANQQGVVTNHPDDFFYKDPNVISWFNGTEKDFPRSKLKYIRELGKGWFGRVVEGAALNVNGDAEEPTWTHVAVRILEATANTQEKIVFLHDAQIYRCKFHTNILRLLGRCLDTVPFLLLQEYCPQGDLKKYLRENQSSSEKLLSSEYPLLWCCELASALKHLHENNLTHPDIATRNCVLTSDLHLKVGDYGLSITNYSEDYYQGAPGVPLRWCAPESLIYTHTTIQPKPVTFDSNVWSLGVTMWEIFECGQLPYSDLNDDEVIAQVLGPPKVRLKRPTYSSIYTDYMFRLMQLCWSSQESRPAVPQIDLMLADLLQVHKNRKDVHECVDVLVDDFDRRWETLKPNDIVKTDNHVTKFEDLEVVSVDNDSGSGQLINDKEMSPSLNNLLEESGDSTSSQMESWLAKVATKTGDMKYVEGLSQVMKDLDSTLAGENTSSSESNQESPPQSLFKRTVEFEIDQSMRQPDSFTHRSSGSETEDENWKRKIERGAYSEKVRQKSRSVADLMVLTHIDCSESDSETPFPSLDYRTNYKHTRFAPRQNLEGAGLKFGSEGNLLSVQDTFQEELRKLQEERRDSLLFVPDKNSQNEIGISSSSDNSVNNDKNGGSVSSVSTDSVLNSPAKKILEELNSPSEIKPANQVYNVFSVTIDPKYSPVHYSLHDDNFNQMRSKNGLNFKGVICEPPLENKIVYEVPRLVDLIQNDMDLLNYIIENYDTESAQDVSEANCVENANPGDNKETSVEQIKNLPSEDAVTDFETSVFNSRRNSVDSENIVCNGESIPDVVECATRLLQDVFNKALKNVEDIKFENAKIRLTSKFLENENTFWNSRRPNNAMQVDFDVSENQQCMQPNSLTHSSVFASTPFSTRNKQFMSVYANENDEERFQFSSNFMPQESENKSLTYCLETWDNFLDQTFEKQSESQDDCFSSFSSEPRSLLFQDNEDEFEGEILKCSRVPETEVDAKSHNELDLDKNEDRLNATYTVVNEDAKKLKCSVKDNNTTYVVDSPNNAELNSVEGSWEAGEGWFLHPQSSTEEITGEMVTDQAAVSDSYVGFGMDDEIMAAIRNELLEKLPYAQSASSRIQEDEECETENKNEIFLKYNILSPIPEEPCSGSISNNSTPREINTDEEDDNWSEPDERVSASGCGPDDTFESPVKGPHFGHTTSQDSCCSNDTLFNLEELTCVITEIDKGETSNSVNHAIGIEDNLSKDSDSQICPVKIKQSDLKVEITDTDKQEVEDQDNLKTEMENDNLKVSEDKFVINMLTEMEHQELHVEKHEYLTYFIEKERESVFTHSVKDDSSDSSLTYKDTVEFFEGGTENMPCEPVATIPTYENVIVNFEKNEQVCDKVVPDYMNVNSPLYDDVNEEDYVNLNNMENSKNIDYYSSKLIDEVESDYATRPDSDSCEDLHVLNDIRFSGPCDGQLMSTSFSESNELADEQGWDSGSDTRSSSSGEFIWKEGEHEETIRALHAVSNDVNNEKMTLLEEVREEGSETSESDEEGDSPEFVPSAWDKYATPSRSALRSPEKTLEQPEKEKKSRGVWFKKQKYHCIYEYPREPESPVLQSFDLWKPSPDYHSLDWEMDTSPYLPPPYENHNSLNRFTEFYNYKAPPEYSMNGSMDDFFISSSPRPFNALEGLSSQFFPGQAAENITPDSGVEDITPDRNLQPCVQSLKVLAAAAIKGNNGPASPTRTSDALGGLRHTRSKLKLDLPPSPSAFSSGKSFAIEVDIEPTVIREVPSFTTFGKSRFLVQQVDTPETEQDKVKNVSFEALPYKPIQTQFYKDDFAVNKKKCKVETVRGEASLLDSADEDSGIESSTLERRKSQSIE